MSLKGTQIPGGFIPRFALLLAVSIAAAGAWAAAPGDGSEWGNSGATPLPQADSGGANCGGDARVCSWWWPVVAASNADDQEIWGNRGMVFGCWQEPDSVIVVGDPPPKDTIWAMKQIGCEFRTVLFAKGKSVIGPEGKVTIDALIEALKAHPDATVVINGHASDEGTDEANMELGQMRADAVARYMIEHGIARERIASVSRGESQPAVPNDNEANRKLNRRVEFETTLPATECVGVEVR